MATTLPGAILKKLTSPPTSEAEFDERGFNTSSAPARAQLEASAKQFIYGYEFAIEQKGHDALTTRLEALEREFRGFAYEGAAMALAIRDALRPTPGPKLNETFLAGPEFDSAPGSKHVYMAYIGLGFALARLPKMLWGRAMPDQSKIVDHPTLRWLIMDGYAFHNAFFEHRKWVDAQYLPKRLNWPGPPGDDGSYLPHALNQGVGRAMWFVYGGDVERLVDAINGFAPERRADLFSGSGLAATYAGGVGTDALKAFYEKAGQYQPDLAQGSVFALRARVVGDVVTPANELAAGVFCNCTAEEASDIAAAEIIDLPEDGTVPAYEVFRQRIMRHFR